MAGGGLRGRAAVATNPRPGVRWGSSCLVPPVPPGSLLLSPRQSGIGVGHCREGCSGSAVSDVTVWVTPPGWRRPWDRVPHACRREEFGGWGSCSPNHPDPGCPEGAPWHVQICQHPGSAVVAPLGTYTRTPLRRHRGGVLGGSWRARGSPGEGGGWMAATRHGGCGEAPAGTGRTGWVPAPGVPGGSGGHATGTARGPAQGHCPQGHSPR